MSDHSQNGPQDPNTPNDPNTPRTPQTASDDSKPFYLRPPMLVGAAVVVAAIIAAVAFMGPSGESGSTPDAKAQTANVAGAETDWELGRPGDIVMGSPDAPVKLVEYASLTCPHCAAFKLAVFPDIKKKYIDTGLVQYTLREFPTPPASLAIAGFMLARCTGEDRYYKAVEALFRTQPVWVKPDPQEARAELEKISRQFGLSDAEFESCINSQQEFDRIRTVANAGQEVFGISGTPSFVVNGQKANIQRPTFEALDSLITERLPEGTEVPDYKPMGYQEPADDDTAADMGSDDTADDEAAEDENGEGAAADDADGTEQGDEADEGAAGTENGEATSEDDASDDGADAEDSADTAAKGEGESETKADDGAEKGTSEDSKAAENKDAEEGGESDKDDSSEK